MSTTTNEHKQPFYGSLNFVWDNPGEPVPEGTVHFAFKVFVLQVSVDSAGL